MKIIPSMQEPLREGSKRWMILKRIWTGFTSAKIPRLYDHIMVSAYYLLKAIASGKLKKGVDIRVYLGIPNDTVVFMDSGGFSTLRQKIHLNPEKIIEVQERAKANVAFAFDYPIDMKCMSEWEICKLRWKNKDLARVFLKSAKDSEMTLYAVIHAIDGEDARDELEKYESLEISGRSFDGYGIGSLVKRKNNHKNIYEIVKAVRESTKKPIHVFGISSLRLIYAFAKLNVTSFDSYTFLRAAMYRELILPQTLKRVAIGVKSKPRIIDGLIPCNCLMCLKANSLGGSKYYARYGSVPNAELAIHNFLVMLNEVKLINESIKNGWFAKLLRDKNLEKYLMSLENV